MNEDHLRPAAAALLARLDTMTTEEFATGADKAERDHLRRALAASEPVVIDLDRVKWPWDVLLLEDLRDLPAALQAGVLGLVGLLHARHYPSGAKPALGPDLLALWVECGLALGGSGLPLAYQTARAEAEAAAAEVTGHRPDMETLEAWLDEGVCEAIDGCDGIEPDGFCPHGQPAWPRYLGLV